jgi:hypothetical protein
LGYFKAHLGVAKGVVAGCAAGTGHGPDCENDAAAIAQRQSNARLNAYRRGF